jgi:hypothetical protein
MGVAGSDVFRRLLLSGGLAHERQMNIPDLINGLFELVGSISLWANVYKLKKDRRISGMYWPTTLFFAGWGLWNCFYYPWLGQWASFTGGCFITTANLVWAGMAFYYTRADERREL